MILVHPIFHNSLNLYYYKRNLKVECVILPLVNANVFSSNGWRRSSFIIFQRLVKNCGVRPSILGQLSASRWGYLYVN